MPSPFASTPGVRVPVIACLTVIPHVSNRVGLVSGKQCLKVGFKNLQLVAHEIVVVESVVA